MNNGKRYKTKQELEDAIDRLRERARLYFKQAEDGDAEAVAQYRCGNVSIGNGMINLAHHRRRRAMNILEKKLPALGQKMAEFLTMQLPGVDNGDVSIPV